MGVVGSSAGLVRVTFPQSSEKEVIRSLGDPERAVLAPQHFESIIERFCAYFGGEITDFTDELDLSGATAFQREVWQAARHIPYGETRSYGWVAAEMGRPGAARAVGQALGRNPLPIIIPCHRVLAADGGIGGFGGGIEVKKFLLSLEGIIIND